MAKATKKTYTKNINGTVVTVTETIKPDGTVFKSVVVPSRKYRPLPPGTKYAPPRPALVRSATPVAHIAHPQWQKTKKNTSSS